jgi:hypothetical protein
MNRKKGTDHRKDLQHHQVQHHLVERDVAENQRDRDQREGDRKADENGDEQHRQSDKSEEFGAHGHSPLVAA